MNYKKENYYIYFKLDTNKLIEKFGKDSYKNVYKTIEKFFYKNNIICVQKHRYKTKCAITNFELLCIFSKFAQEYTDIVECLDTSSYSAISKEHDISIIIKTFAKISLILKNIKIKKKKNKNI